ncbi:AraC family transcriptional regulator [Luteimonas sp. SJ-92]|uniref:AraC family transcriptional regulator n=1 Tax=Luteimonas salinisoli TaxID=2752307 RepID=A0A853JG05_9GAMM|nr:AraC family transcriptional regulator [Luteimonas salinisoli]NZA27785.1 AraC family transcriptional regulator [Luteimonas salinisoli]
MKSADSSTPPAAGPAPVDRLAALLDRFHVHAELFHTGPLCGLHVFDPAPGRAFLHVLRRGTMEVVHRGAHGLVRTALAEPTLLLFARPVHHEFHNAPVDGADFTCATLDFDGGARNPIVQSLPAMLAVPLAAVDGLAPTLDLLFAEADRVRCGSRLLAGRLFEVLLVQVLRWALDHPTQSGVDRGTLAGLSHPQLARALTALHARPAEPWPLERLAAQAGMSRSAFAAAFKHAVGTTPAAYVLDWRLGLAATRLREGRTVKQVAHELGFAEAGALSKAFRRRYGVSPRGWSGTGYASGG